MQECLLFIWEFITPGSQAIKFKKSQVSSWNAIAKGTHSIEKADGIVLRIMQSFVMEENAGRHGI